MEDETLAPLIHVALRAVRGDAAVETSGNFVDQVRNKAVELWEEAKPTVERTWDQAKHKWDSLSDQERLIAQAGGGGFVLLTFMFLFLWRRRRRRRRGDAAAAMVAPSAEYEGSHGNESEETEGDSLEFEEYEEESSVR